MATTGAITLSSATATTGQPIAVTLTLTNGGSVAVTVLSAFLTLSPVNAPAGIGQMPLGPSQPNSVAGSSGTLALTTGFTPYSPPAQGNVSAATPPTEVYTIGATALMSDGTTVTATTSTLTVSALVIG